MAAVKKIAKPKAKGTKKKLKKPGKAPKFEAGMLVQFAGYAEKNDDPYFTEGDTVYIAEVQENEETKEPILVAIKPEDKDAYESDPDSVNGEQLTVKEVRKFKGKPPAAKIKVKDVGELAKIIKKGDLLETAKSLFNDANKNFFYFGGVLAHMFHEDKYKEYGYDDPKTGWDDFCQAEFGFKGRKGIYWSDIYLSFSQVEGFDVKKLDKVGWSKAALIAPYAKDKPEQADELIEKAADSTVVELKETLATEYTTSGSKSGQGTRTKGKIKRIKFTFSLFEDQAEGVRMILDAAAKQLANDDADQVFEHIVTEWGGDHLTETRVAAAKRAVASKQKALAKAGVKVPEKKAA